MKKSKLSTKPIPVGYYCYDKKGNCPYWSIRKDKPEQRNGYCAYLGKGDWDINKEKRFTLIEFEGKKIPKNKRVMRSANEAGIPGSLLFDQCKECGIKEK